MDIPKSTIDGIIKTYENGIKNFDEKAKEIAEETGRKFGGIIRMKKGGVVETIAAMMIASAWVDVLKRNKADLSIDASKFDIPFKKEHLSRIKDQAVRNHIEKNIGAYSYKLGTDLHVKVKESIKFFIECKAYSENAMMKRILIDADLLRSVTKVNKYFLLQLESQLGGDYSELNKVTFGSKPTQTLISYFNDIDFEIITLLKGERKIDRPIHNSEFYKELNRDSVIRAISIFADALK